MTLHVRLVALLISPWLEVHQNNKYSGIQVNLMNYIARSLNFTYEISIIYDGAGLKLDNGTWTGMIGRIQNNVILLNLIIMVIILLFLYRYRKQI